MNKISEETKTLIMGAVILLILVAVGFVFSKLLVELWFCAFKFLVKKKMVNLAIIVLELPGMMLGGLVVSTIACVVCDKKEGSKKRKLSLFRKVSPFKSIDEKFKEIGFNKIEEDEYGVRYERYVEEYKFTHTIDLLHKASGRHIVQSCDNELSDQKNIGCTCVGLTMYEMKLCIKKMKQMGWKIQKQ